MSISSILIFLLVLCFLEFCVFCYFTPNLRSFFNKTVDEEPVIDEAQTNKKNIQESISYDIINDEWKTDEYVIDDNSGNKPVEEEWKEDIVRVKINNIDSQLLEIDPDFKIDEFYNYIFKLYSKIAESYSNDDIRAVSSLMSKELYQDNVRQLDYFRRKNMKHLISVTDFLNCKIIDMRKIEGNLYVKVELSLKCYDYIIDRTTEKVVKGIGKKPLNCVFHLILKRKMTSLHFSRSAKHNPVIPEIVTSSNLNDDDWILVSNRIVRRRSR